MSTLKFVTWNIRGVNSQAKKTKIIYHLSKLQADICLLQETHLSPTDEHKLNSPHYNQIYSATHNSKKRGVSILINKKIPLIKNSTIIDPEGRYIILNASLYNNNITIANVYGPNSDDPSFFHTFFSLFIDIPDSIMVIGGDFNTVLDHTVDRSNISNTFKPWNSSEILKQYVSEFGLGDIWRLQNLNSREYSYFSHIHK